MRKFLTAFTIFSCATSIYAQQSPMDLAIETYKAINSYESMLQGAINSNSKENYNRFIWQPTITQFQKWPPTTDTNFNKYRSCQWAIDSFRVYSQDQFYAAGKLGESTPSYRDFINRKRECASKLKGKI